MVNAPLLKNKIQLVSAVIFLSSAVSGQIPIAVVEFEGKNISQAEASILTDRLRNELFRTDAFQVIEREMVEQILSEQDFQLSGCTTNECLVEVGKLVGVGIIVGGSIGKVGNVFTVSARLVDVETGKLVQVTDYDYEGEIGELLKSGMRGVALELSGEKITGIDPERASDEEWNEFSQYRLMGFSVIDLDSQEAQNYSFEAESGVLVAKVNSSSTAAKGGIQPGDVVVKVGNNNINNLHNYRQSIEDYKEGETVLLRMVRGNSIHLVAIDLNHQANDGELRKNRNTKRAFLSLGLLEMLLGFAGIIFVLGLTVGG